MYTHIIATHRYTDRRFCYILLADSDSLSDSKLNNNFATTMYVQVRTSLHHYVIRRAELQSFH